MIVELMDANGTQIKCRSMDPPDLRHRVNERSAPMHARTHDSLHARMDARTRLVAVKVWQDPRGSQSDPLFYVVAPRGLFIKEARWAANLCPQEGSAAAFSPSICS
jgi:hypothetical protein